MAEPIDVGEANATIVRELRSILVELTADKRIPRPEDRPQPPGDSGNWYWSTAYNKWIYYDGEDSERG